MFLDERSVILELRLFVILTITENEIFIKENLMSVGKTRKYL